MIYCPILIGGIVLPALLALALLGGLFGLVLAIAAKKFHVHVDPKIEEILDVLPGANCGACGLPGCAGYAEAVVKGKAEPNLCAPGGADVCEKIAKILGIEVGAAEPNVAIMHCSGGNSVSKKYHYEGIDSCKAAAALAGGDIGCEYGCLRFYDCIGACCFKGIEIRDDGLPAIDPSLCVGCGACVKACPRNLINLVPASKKVHIMCSNPERGKAVKSVCAVGCIGCTKCVKVCPVEAISMQDGLAKIDYSKCINCGKCARECPVQVIYNFKKQDPITWLPPISEIYPKPANKTEKAAS